MIHQQDIIFNLRSLSNTDTVFDILLNVENLLDQACVFAYRHWEMGELVEGPLMERYWVHSTWMWPRSLMPDPRAGLRLIKLGCKLQVREDEIEVTQRVTSASGTVERNGRKRQAPKKTVPVWVLELSVPRRLVDDSFNDFYKPPEANIEDVLDVWEAEIKKLEDQGSDAGDDSGDDNMGDFF